MTTLRKYHCLLCILVAGTMSANAQAPFYEVEYMNVNKIKAAHGLHGDLWRQWSGPQPKAGCEFPAGSGKHLAMAAGLWMGGYDSASVLHGAATIYRTAGQEYWPGPLQGTDTSISYQDSEKWARVWKIDRSTVLEYLALTSHTLTNTPAAVLEWPAKGNIYARGRNGSILTVTDDMAPFIDVNGDDIYDPLAGDHPKLKGGQMLWFVFNDNGPLPHTEVTALPACGAEVKMTVYGYDKANALGNVLYYELTLKNKKQHLDSFTLGLFADLDLGAAEDDHIGFDSSRNMVYCYNANQTDGFGAPESYGDSLPMAAIRFLEFPSNTCESTNALGIFMYFKGGAGLYGYPTSGADIYGYLNHTWRDGSPLKKPSQGQVSQDVYSMGYGGTGAPASYVFDGQPSLHGLLWQECHQQNPPEDRRFVMALKPQALAKGQSMRLSFALVAADRELNNGCPSMNFSRLNEVSDSASLAYCNPPLTSVPSTEPGPPNISIYPNPAKNTIRIDGSIVAGCTVSSYNMVGQKISAHAVWAGNSVTIDLTQFTPGIYQLVVTSGNAVKTFKLVKE